MSTLDAAAMPFAEPRAEIRTITSADLNWALAEGWRDFRAKRGDLIFAGVLYPVICLLAIVMTINGPLLPLLFPLVAGASIVGPAVASGFYELAKRREDGEDASWWHFLDPVRGRSRVPLAVLTLMLAGLFVGWLIAAYLIYITVFAGLAPMALEDVANRMFTTSEGISLIIVGHLAGLAFAIVTLVTSWVSFPMVIDKPVDAWTALQTSLAAARQNPGAAIGWGVRIGALMVLGSIPAGIGLAIVFPWLGYSTWHLYTRLVAR